ncbi:MAG: 30S ribosomal protein S12 methylthiotransferase RimO [Bacillota bacterium]
MALKVGMIALGCAKNLVDSERMLGVLRAAGFEITRDSNRADVLIVNTCGFIGPAKEESIKAVLDAARAKEFGACRALVVTGCLSERYRDELWQELPEVDAMGGTGAAAGIVDLVREAMAGTRPRHFEGCDISELDRLPRVLATPAHTAYLRIAEGCDNRCAYCVIPTIRGPLRSRSLGDVLEEAQRLVASGVKELVLIAQDTTAYGHDRRERQGLDVLIRELGQVDANWVRVMYAHPAHLDEKIIAAMAASPNCCAYLDLPLQHASPSVLARMGRPPLEVSLGTISRLREAIPAIALRSTFMVGFPGETEADVQLLLGFLEEMAFDHVGVFVYSLEDDTPAATMTPLVDEKEAVSRRDRAMSLQQSIARRNNAGRVGSIITVLVDRSGRSRSYGRGEHQAPEVDGQVIIRGKAVPAGELVRVRITGAGAYDLKGELV